MSLFGFDEQYIRHDATPVDNLFLLDHMPAAKGDYVKVYLYGLMCCHHPYGDGTLEGMAEALCMEKDEIEKAYRYWERRGLVRRISDHPPEWRYVAQDARSEVQADESYVQFAEALQSCFSDRRITSSEIAMAYDWVENMGLPTEAELMLVTYQAENRGRHFTFKSAEKLAARMQDEGVKTVKDAEDFFSRDRKAVDGAKKILRILGKRHFPSEPELYLYIAWTKELGFEHAAIEKACEETTKGTPTFAYLDGILRGMYERSGSAVNTIKGMTETRDKEAAEAAPLKEVIRAMNLRLAVNDTTLAIYKKMQSLYPDEVILIAAKECAKKSGAALDDVMQLLESWTGKGLRNEADVREYVERFRKTGQKVRELHEKWGMDGRRIESRERTAMEKWTDTLGMDWSGIVFCAELASGKNDPISYTDKLLTGFAEKGLTTMEAMADEYARRRDAWQKEKTAAPQAAAKKPAQSYGGQRTYTENVDVSDMMNELFRELVEREKHGQQQDPQ